MARPLLEPEADRTAAFHAGGSPATSILVLIAVTAVAAVVVSLCTSGKNVGHRNKHRRSSSLAPAPQQQDDNNNNSCGKRNNKPQLLASLSGIGVKAAAVAKMVSWKRSPAAGGWSDGDGEEGEGGAAGVEEEDEALWKKTIILGDKCRPLEFSGHIAFDSDGNPVQPPSPPAVKEDVAPGAANQA
ncbi:hypothetical protein HU200_060376 [Digitaria exilis]|uniref:Uncharacterized protein n=1 Tax=Digitaria exilis TaxID=1010633 RepID=A0A835AES4_9POAL|nr:hypothetical protein HU200_060376 [Digitaria exilis]CAB3476558.1 unnamed protein product [Digitaria exilis]